MLKNVKRKVRKEGPNQAKGYAKLLGRKEVYYGKCANGELAFFEDWIRFHVLLPMDRYVLLIWVFGAISVLLLV